MENIFSYYHFYFNKYGIALDGDVQKFMSHRRQRLI